MMSNFRPRIHWLAFLGGGSPVKFNAGDMDVYVTNKALDGPFKMVADEEKNIRANPVARTTDLLKIVFGAAQ